MPSTSRTLAGRATGTRRAATLRQSPAETARRIVRSMREHAAVGIVRTPTEYTQDAGTLRAVAGLLGEGEAHGE